MKVLATEVWSGSVRSLPRINHKFIFAIALMALVSLFHTSARANSSVSGQIDGTVLTTMALPSVVQRLFSSAPRVSKLIARSRISVVTSCSIRSWQRITL